MILSLDLPSVQHFPRISWQIFLGRIECYRDCTAKKDERLFLHPCRRAGDLSRLLIMGPNFTADIRVGEHRMPNPLGIPGASAPKKGRRNSPAGRLSIQKLK